MRWIFSVSSPQALITVYVRPLTQFSSFWYATMTAEENKEFDEELVDYEEEEETNENNKNVESKDAKK